MPWLSTARWRVAGSACSRAARISGQRWSLFGLMPKPSVIESPKATIAAARGPRDHVDARQLGPMADGPRAGQIGRRAAIAVDEEGGRARARMAGPRRRRPGQIEGDGEVAERRHGEIDGIGDGVRARREGDRVMAGEGHGAAAARRDPRRGRIGGAGDLDGFDPQRPRAEGVGEADADALAAQADPHHLAHGRVGQIGLGEAADRDHLRARPGPDPMRAGPRAAPVRLALRRAGETNSRDEQGDGGEELVHDHANSLSRTAGSASRARSGAMPLGHQLPALHIILDRIDAVERDDPALAQIDRRKAARRRLAADDDVVMTDRKADRLQPQIILVGPEPGHRRIRLGRAGDRLGRDIRLIVGVLDGFQPDPRAARKGVFMRGAIADRIDVRQGRSGNRRRHGRRCSPVAPACESGATAASMPIPTITMSAGISAPSARRTPLAAPFSPSMQSTRTPVRRSTPWARCSAS